MYDRITISRAPKAGAVFATFSDDRALPKSDRSAARDAAASAASFRAELGETTSASDGSVILGLGKKADFNAKAARSAGARLVRGLERMKVAKARLAFGGLFGAREARELAQAMGEGMGLANWRVDMFDGKAAQRAPRAGSLAIDAGAGAFGDGFA
ncbi:MAG: M17 family peptidase N-terminal domain-containing protein, partial [bacterium]